MFTVVTLVVLFLSSFILTLVNIIFEGSEIAYFASRSNNEQERDFNAYNKPLRDVLDTTYTLCLHSRNFALCINLARWYLIVRQNKV